MNTVGGPGGSGPVWGPEKEEALVEEKKEGSPVKERLEDLGKRFFGAVEKRISGLLGKDKRELALTLQSISGKHLSKDLCRLVEKRGADEVVKEMSKEQVGGLAAELTKKPKLNQQEKALVIEVIRSRDESEKAPFRTLFLRVVADLVLQDSFSAEEGSLLLDLWTNEGFGKEAGNQILLQTGIRKLAAQIAKAETPTPEEVEIAKRILENQEIRARLDEETVAKLPRSVSLEVRRALSDLEDSLAAFEAGLEFGNDQVVKESLQNMVGALANLKPESALDQEMIGDALGKILEYAEELAEKETHTLQEREFAAILVESKEIQSRLDFGTLNKLSKMAEEGIFDGIEVHDKETAEALKGRALSLMSTIRENRHDLGLDELYEVLRLYENPKFLEKLIPYVDIEDLSNAIEQVKSELSLVRPDPVKELLLEGLETGSRDTLNEALVLIRESLDEGKIRTQEEAVAAANDIRGILDQLEGEILEKFGEGFTDAFLEKLTDAAWSALNPFMNEGEFLKAIDWPRDGL